MLAGLTTTIAIAWSATFWDRVGVHTLVAARPLDAEIGPGERQNLAHAELVARLKGGYVGAMRLDYAASTHLIVARQESAWGIWDGYALDPSLGIERVAPTRALARSPEPQPSPWQGFECSICFDAGWPARALWCRVGAVSPGSRVPSRVEGGFAVAGSTPRPLAGLLVTQALPFRALWAGLAADTAVWGGAWWALVEVWGRIIRRERDRAFRCPRCGFDRRGSDRLRCAECGYLAARS